VSVHAWAPAGECTEANPVVDYSETSNTFCGTWWYLPHSHVHNERTVPIIMAECMAHARNGYISTSGLKSDVIIMFLDPDFLKSAKIFAIRYIKADIGLLDICMGAKYRKGWCDIDP